MFVASVGQCLCAPVTCFFGTIHRGTFSEVDGIAWREDGLHSTLLLSLAEGAFCIHPVFRKPRAKAAKNRPAPGRLPDP